MHHVRIKALCVIMILCMCVLSSCGSKEFKFDDAITWNSSYEDIVKKYGEPDRTGIKEDTDNVKSMFYDDFTCCGIDGFTLGVYIDEKKNKANEVRVFNYEITNFSKGRDDYDIIVKALTKKYGVPTNSTENHTSKYDNDVNEWVQPVKDTYIMIYYYKSSYYGECRIDLTYESTANLQLDGI